MSDTIAVPSVVHLHDRAFRNAMSDLRVARDFLSHYLPTAVLKKINLSTLAMRKETYVDAEFKALVTDALYSVSLTNALGDAAFIYVLCEHLSKPDHLAPWRMLKYICRIVDQHLTENGNKQLPAVIPVVIYNGEKAYPYSTRLYDLFAESEKELVQQHMFTGFQLIDFSQIPDEQMRQHQWSSVMEILLKHTWSRDIMGYLESLSQEIRRLAYQQADSYLLGMLKYVVQSSEIQDEERFQEFLEQSLPQELEEQAMTLAQLWEQRGEQRGIQKGMQAGERSLLLRQLERKFHVIPEQYRQRIMQADNDMLLHWGESLIDAQTLPEVFE